VEVKSDGRIQILTTIPSPSSLWETVTSQREIEKHLLRRNKRHLQQIAKEGGPSTHPPVKQLTESLGTSEDARAVLDGTYVTEEDGIEVNATLAEWIKQLKQTDTEKGMADTVGSIPPEALQEAFKAAKERTASHGDLHYTVWKAMTADDHFAAWLSIMISIPFMFGFAPERWKTMTDVMIEKKKGVRKIHQLRIIGLLQADLNTALKYFGREFSRKMEASGELSDEQWGSRNKRTATDAAMIKLLTFETARAQKSTIGMLFYDCTACFDRMHPSLSNIELRKRNFDEGILLMRSAVIGGMKRHVRTGLGVSEDYYEGKLPGEIQGKSDVPHLFAGQSSTMLNTHAACAPGLELHSCTGQRAMRRHNVMYVDDNDGNVSVPVDSERPLDALIENMQLSSQIWNDVVNWTGQSLAYHKTSWQALAWQVVQGELKPFVAKDRTIILEDHKGAKSVIQFMPPDQPNKGLGYHLCPDGNQHHEYRVVMEKLREVAASASTAFLNAREARQLLYQRLMPAIDYKLQLTSFTEQQCHSMNTVVRKNFFPLMHFNRNSADAVMRGPLSHGGMDLPELFSRQTELQVENVIKQLRNGGTVANDFLVTLDMIQLISGLTTPIFEYAEKKLEYLDKGFIVALHDRMSEIDASIWIEEAWVPKLQREGDESIMEAFLERSSINWQTLRKLNAVRIYLRVITIADLAVGDGVDIGHTTLQGDWRAGSDLKWPRQPKPPEAWFQLFRKHIRETFCTRLDARHNKNASMALDIPLKRWYEVSRNTWFESYRSPTAIYRRYKDVAGTITGKIQLLIEKPKNSGYYRYERDVKEVPANSYPMATLAEIGEGVWSRRPYLMHPKQETTRKPPGYIEEDTRKPGWRPEKTCSDGSVHQSEGVAAAAYIISDNDEQYVKACYLMTNISSVNSYRAELEGAYRALHHMELLGEDPAEFVTQWFDNESGVLTSNIPPTSRKSMMQPEGDLILAIHHLKKKIAGEIVSKHVRGHQDTRRTESSTQEDDGSVDSLATTESTSNRNKRVDIATLSDEAKMNIACDELAGEATAWAIEHPGELPPPDELMQMPYEGSKAVLRIGQTWITANEKRHLKAARQEPIIEKYIKKRHKWNTHNTLVCTGTR